MSRNEARTSIDTATWAPWAREFLAVVDEVRTVAASPADDTIKRLKLAELGMRTRRLLDQVGCQPALPGAFGRAIEVLRSPVDADPISVGEALARLGRLALVLDGHSESPRRSPRPGGLRRSPDQESLPGFEPRSTNEGAPE